MYVCVWGGGVGGMAQGTGGTHTPKYPDQLLRIEIKKIFKVMCSFDQNIGLLPLVSTVSQK